ncbi:hypothetical protein GCM10025867_25390 [Frondihabitans sucicola]|uniref:Small multi-drug export protein n=1 Tax=Frondihabitans sucicola TaxID=1268041 RepID=A0ABM8GPF8_9MICO|nr:hypothetical protein [Frondihabitans sucicola]BDZ50298.1 hypothetical protein GCM10025867_25390 [Frondihabitans sucicola]
MIENLQHFTQAFPEWLQWLAVALVAMIPFVESYTGTLIGVAIGLHPAVAVTAAISGNAVAMILIVLLTQRIRNRARRNAAEEPARPGRVRRMVDRFGVPGVALLGHPTQFSSAAMIGFGIPCARVITWELISMVTWGVLIAVLSGLGLSALSA